MKTSRDYLRLSIQGSQPLNISYSSQNWKDNLHVFGKKSQKVILSCMLEYFQMGNLKKYKKWFTLYDHKFMTRKIDKYKRQNQKSFILSSLDSFDDTKGTIYCESQLVLKTLAFKQLSPRRDEKRSRIRDQVIWVTGHSNVEGNQCADQFDDA